MLLCSKEESQGKTNFKISVRQWVSEDEPLLGYEMPSGRRRKVVLLFQHIADNSAHKLNDNLGKGCFHSKI